MRVLFSILIAACLLSPAYSQKKLEPSKNFEVSVTHADFRGETKTIREIVHRSPTSPSKRAQQKRNKIVHKNFIGRGKSKTKIPGLEHQGNDPIRQTSLKMSGRQSETLVNRQGLFDSSDPQDPTGAAGHNYYVQAINATTIAVYDKDGTLIQEFSGNSLWAEINESSLGDPIILYDQTVRKWVITEFSSPSEMLIAVSHSDDPLGSYDLYSFATPAFPDYPKYGIWSNAYVITTNEDFSGSNLTQYFLDRNALLNGEEDVTIQRIQINGNSNTEAGFYVSTPVMWTGLFSPEEDLPMVVRLNDSSWGDIAEDAIEVYQFDVDFSDAANTQITNTTITTTPFDGNPCTFTGGGDFPCIPQSGGNALDGIPEVILNVPQYRNFGTHESIVMTFITDVANGANLAGLRWVELRRTDGAWELYQEGTYAPDDGLNRFMGSIGIDKDGNLGMGFNVSSDTTFVGVRYTGRLAEDPLGEMTFDEVIAVEGTTTINSSTRFGDYAHISLDPLDSRTFWYTTEYAGATASNDASTRIVAFRLERDSVDIAPVAITAPTSSGDLSNTETVTVQVKNIGVDTVESFDITLQFEGVDQETFTFNEDLLPDSLVNHTFSTMLDLSQNDTYQISTFITLATDENEFNDTLSQEVINFAALDAGILSLDVPATTCGERLQGTLSIKNEGADTLTTLNVEILQNGSSLETINWTGEVLPGKSEELDILIPQLILGANTISIELSNPNGGVDENNINDSVEETVTYDDGAVQVRLELTTDNFPDETTWQLTELNSSEILYSGGPYGQEETLFVEEFCLDSTKCYTFQIFDSFDDGICCGQNGDGSYQLVNNLDEVIVSSTGEFGGAESNSFCLGDCILSATVEVTDSKFNDGVILITASGGIPPFEYSIDSGANFKGSNIFNNVAPGEYDVMVRSQNVEGCEYRETVTVGTITDSQTALDQINVNVIPNPNDGVFQVVVDAASIQENYLMIQVLNIDGKIIQEKRINKYDQQFIGPISLYDYPDGVYLIRYLNKDINLITKVIKEQ